MIPTQLLLPGLWVSQSVFEKVCIASLVVFLLACLPPLCCIQRISIADTRCKYCAYSSEANAETTMLCRSILKGFGRVREHRCRP
jgi:hypothetical protein